MKKVLKELDREDNFRTEADTLRPALENQLSDLETAAANSDIAQLTEDETGKKKYLSNAEEMNTAIQNFAENHNTIIQNKEDQMGGQMTSWQNSFINKHRERQYHRNRQRIIDIKKVIDECRAEISAAAEAGDED